MNVFQVRVTNHQHSVTSGAYRHTDAGTADYVHQDTGAIWANDSERRPNRAKRTFQIRDDNLVEGNETFTARIAPTDNVVDLNDPDRDEKCEITIIDDDPNITDIEVTPEPARDDTYRVGETIEISATFSTSVDVDGNPGLGMWVGSDWRSASYLRGSGSDTLVFGYTVQEGDVDIDGISISANKLTLNGGTIQDEAANDATLTHDAVAADSGHKVDGSDTTAPTISSLSITSDPGSDYTYGTGDTIQVTVTFSEDVTITGTQQLELKMYESTPSARQASYSSGADVVFKYTVAVGDSATTAWKSRPTSWP